MHGDDGGQMTTRQQAELGIGMVSVLSRIWAMLLARAGTVGYRRVSSGGAAVSMAILALFAGIGQSAVLGVMLALAVLSQLEHRFKTKRGRDRHSHSFGESHLSRFFGGRARGAEVCLALAVSGGCFLAEDQAAGLFFMLSALGHAMTIGFMEQRQRESEDDVNDAAIDMRQRSYRQHGGGVRKPWELHND